MPAPEVGETVEEETVEPLEETEQPGDSFLSYLQNK